MSGEKNDFSAAIELMSFAPANVVWRLDSEAPQLAHALDAVAPWARAARDELVTRLPTAKTCRVFSVDPFFRPAGHYRAIYMHGQGDGVLAIKGTEVVAD